MFKIFIRYQKEIVLAIAFILVFIISFGMGRLSVLSKNSEPIFIENARENIKEPMKKGSAMGIFVGSVNSSKYHLPDCYWATRIKKENQIWFKSEADARLKGYEPSNCVKQQK